MPTLCANGWTIDRHRVFNEQYDLLIEDVKKRKEKLERADFLVHPNVKRLKRLQEIIEQKIPQNPCDIRFRLTGDLAGYSRVKGMGLTERYRLFFRVFEDEKRIIILWLGYPRKEGDRKDCYTVFKKMVARGLFPDSLESLLSQCDPENL